jgi:phage terminase large subunit-like protein
VTSPACSAPCAARWATPAAGRPDLARQTGLIAAELGFRLMPWQQAVLAVATELGEDKKLAYRQAGVTVPRQSGKSTLMLCLMCCYALGRPGTRIIYTAQTRLDARRMLLDEWWPRIAASRLGQVVKARRGYGTEALMFANGSRLSLVSSSQKAGHGDSVDLFVLDEAWAQGDDRLEQALRPAMITRPDPQLFICSTAGTDASAYLRSKVADGRARAELGVTDTACYFEWSAADDADPSDPQVWAGCMPALNITASPAAVAADYELMARAEFRRAYLNQWPEVARPGWAEISQERWMSCHNPQMAL